MYQTAEQQHNATAGTAVQASQLYDEPNSPSETADGAYVEV
eukprot:gene31033-31052_t